jgi:hypothetical protein
MEAQDLEHARHALTLFREALAGRSTRLTGPDGAALVASVHGLTFYLLIKCADPNDIEGELIRIESLLRDRLADALVAGVDWDALDWSG